MPSLTLTPRGHLLFTVADDDEIILRMKLKCSCHQNGVQATGKAPKTYNGWIGRFDSCGDGLNETIRTVDTQKIARSHYSV